MTDKSRHRKSLHGRFIRCIYCAEKKKELLCVKSSSEQMVWRFSNSV